MPRHGLTDGEWQRLCPLPPPQKGSTGRPAKDHRVIFDALLWLVRTGAPWRDLPACYGPWQTVATRLYRWINSGLSGGILTGLLRIADARGRVAWDLHMVDATNVRAHRCAAGGKGGAVRQALGRSRGGYGSKLHLRCDRRAGRWLLC